MAKRITLTHSADVRTKIQTSQLINRLTNHAIGKVELSQTQVKAIQILLAKSLPDLSSVTLRGDENSPVKQVITWKSE